MYVNLIENICTTVLSYIQEYIGNFGLGTQNQVSPFRPIICAFRRYFGRSLVVPLVLQSIRGRSGVVLPVPRFSNDD